MSPQTKKCSKCGEEKELEHFHRNKGKKFGRHNWCKSCFKEYCNNNKEARRRNQKRYVAKPEAKKKIQEAKKRRRKENGRWEQTPEGREWAREYHKRYRENNRERVNEIQLQAVHRRRARVLENGYEHFTEEQLVEHWISEGIDPEKCFYCEDGLYEEKDHYHPISKGGAHTMENLRPSCGVCNRRKGAILPEEFEHNNKRRTTNEK